MLIVVIFVYYTNFITKKLNTWFSSDFHRCKLLLWVLFHNLLWYVVHDLLCLWVVIHYLRFTWVRVAFSASELMGVITYYLSNLGLYDISVWMVWFVIKILVWLIDSGVSWFDFVFMCCFYCLYVVQFICASHIQLK